MPVIDYIDTGKLTALRALPSPRVCELVSVAWGGATGTRYYASSQYDELPGYETLRDREFTVEPRFAGERFKDVSFSSGLEDESVDLDFSDIDGQMRALYAMYGAGVRVEVFYYFPEIDWLVGVWWGHLKPPDGADAEIFKVKAAAG